MNLEPTHSVSFGHREQEPRVENKGLQSLLEKLDRLMAKTQPGKRDRIRQIFRDLYPTMEAYRTQGKSLKDLLTAFNELAQGKVCARTFNDLFEEERALRDRNGDPVCCNVCGNALHQPRSNETSTDLRSAASPPTDPTTSD